MGQGENECPVVTALSTHTSNNVFRTGNIGHRQFSGKTATCGSTTVISLTVPNQPSATDIFVAKWHPGGPPTTT